MCAENGGFVDVDLWTGFRTFLVGFYRRSGSIEFFPKNGRFVDRSENDSTEVPPVLWHFISRKIQYPIDFLIKTWYNIFTE